MASTKPHSQPRSEWVLPVTVVCIALGALTAFQVRAQQYLSQTRVGVRGGPAARAEQLANMYSNAQAQIKALEAQVNTLRVQQYINERRTISSGQLKNDLRDYKLAVGLLKARGKGIQLVLDDSALKAADGMADNPLIVHDYDLLAVVNELRAARAEAIAVNGQRMTPFSAIRCRGPVIEVNGIAIGSPYEIVAIGEPNVLVSALQLPGGILSQLKPLKIKVTLQKVDSIAVPAAAEPPKFRYASEVIEEEK